MELDKELSLWHTKGAYSWKCLQRRLSPADRLFEAGDLACRLRVHKYICDAESYSSNSDIHTLVEWVATCVPLILTFQLYVCLI